uniref:VWFA domain-containing protein n=1 Tax=Erpetoichthys calabaricus TaxID=27687 RepID=A0A8C4TMR5_ERPCA
MAWDHHSLRYWGMELLLASGFCWSVLYMPLAGQEVTSCLSFLLVKGSSSPLQADVTSGRTAVKKTHLWVPFKGPLNPRAALCHKCDCVPVPWTESPQLLFSLKASAPAVTADIIFLVDSSWSIGKDNFQFVREFLYKVVKALKTGGGDFKFALVQYSGSPKTEFQLSTYSSVQDVLFHIWSMPYLGGGTRTGLGLEYLIEQHLTAAAGSRANEGVPQVVVVLTDGRSQDDVIPPSSVLQLADVDVFAVGVHHAVEWELKEMQIATDPSFVFSTPDLSAIDVLQDHMVGYLKILRCTHLFLFSSTDQKDIVFLIDGSNNVGDDFPSIRDFILRFIEPLDIGIDQIRFSVIQYSDQPNANFYLNTYSTKEQVVSAVNGMTLLQGDSANLGAALTFLKDTVFTQTYGSRISEKVPQILIVLSTQRLRDSVRSPAIALKTAGVVPLTIGAKNANANEMKIVAIDPSYSFVVSDYNRLCPFLHSASVLAVQSNLSSSCTPRYL